ncbi:pili assembly chaperone [Chlorogloeopsis fritschii PCC 6912]|uniref:Pili assembly chaperone n=1 Tax=Chlorogloeopsis fritschii PCC 6912 TaxID=211165 RepID=A0A3S0ZCF6_CHLFR|nr:type IV pilin-like G/H family protein [Chlorogloeopsis fritschii]RUR73463.1 pili assembly chaperone [Chlorogloeopsis fritschii PCC 6912]
MKTELKAKFLQHILNKKKEDEGFTLIELLVVIIIIGILSAIALPSFLNQANKAKQSEAKTYVGSMNRAQQAYYLENNAFAAQADFGKLGLGIATQTTNYIYTIADGGTTNPSLVTNQAATVVGNAPLKTYVGGVSVATQAATSEATTIAILCEANQARVNGGAVVAPVTATANGPACPTGFTALR